MKFTELSCIPIYTDEESLNSIIISELELSTEPSLSPEKENIEDNDKSESFVELYKKYEEQFIHNSTSEVNEGEETPLKKRSSISDEELSDVEENSQSIIAKIDTIVDPEVRKEFELELNNNGQVAMSEMEKMTEVGTDYDPNYAKKVVNVTEKQQEAPTVNRLQTEINSVQSDFQELQIDDVDKRIPDEVTTIPLSVLRDTGFVEVFEQVFYHPTEEEQDDVTTEDLPNVHVDFDPIQIIPENPDEFRNFDSEVTTEKVEDFAESTESSKVIEMMTVYDETVYDRTELNENSGRSFNYPNFSDETVTNEAAVEVTTSTTEILTTPLCEEPTTIPPFFEYVTEIIEDSTEIVVSINVNGSSVEKPVKPLSTSEKSSEESNSSDKSDKATENTSDSSEENSAKEILDRYEFRILDLPTSDDQVRLMDDLYKDTLHHDIKKKDHPIVYLGTTDHISETNDRSFKDKEKAQHLEQEMKPDDIKTIDVTTVGIYETFEDIVTTIADGIELSREFQVSVDSFRSVIDESETVLDTNNEAVSSKNIKNSLVNIVEEMTLENHVKNTKISYIVLSVVTIGSVVFLIISCAVIKKTLARMSLL